MGVGGDGRQGAGRGSWVRQRYLRRGRGETWEGREMELIVHGSCFFLFCFVLFCLPTNIHILSLSLRYSKEGVFTECAAINTQAHAHTHTHTEFWGHFYPDETGK